jgi:hypothetical protein
MPELSDISYSHDATVTAFRDYYRFLITMYLDESAVMEPPEGGWPTITSDTWVDFDKTDEVFSLLRHIPYMRLAAGNEAHQSVPEGQFADWTAIPADWQGEDIKEMTEIPSDEGEIPPHIVGLTSYGEYCPKFLLDTELGVVYWPECAGEINTSGPDQVRPDPYDWAEDEIIPESQAEWRASGGIWAIEDFFEMLKFHFRELNFVPIGSRVVEHIWITRSTKTQALFTAITEVYRKNGRPDLTRFRKQDCLADMKSMLEARFPGEVPGWTWPNP